MKLFDNLVNQINKESNWYTDKKVIGIQIRD